MKKRVAIMGGDLRMCMLAKLFAEDGYEIHTYALEQMDIEEELKTAIIIQKTIKDLIDKTDIIISGIPLSRDYKTIDTPFSKETILLETFFERTKK